MAAVFVSTATARNAHPFFVVAAPAVDNRIALRPQHVAARRSIRIDERTVFGNISDLSGFEIYVYVLVQPRCIESNRNLGCGTANPRMERKVRTVDNRHRIGGILALDLEIAGHLAVLRYVVGSPFERDSLEILLFLDSVVVRHVAHIGNGIDTVATVRYFAVELGMLRLGLARRRRNRSGTVGLGRTVGRRYPQLVFRQIATADQSAVGSVPRYENIVDSPYRITLHAARTAAERRSGQRTKRNAHCDIAVAIAYRRIFGQILFRAGQRAEHHPNEQENTIYQPFVHTSNYLSTPNIGSSVYSS